MTSKLEVGDLVWAKMKNFSPWPARVVEPQKSMKRPVMKKPMHCVFFYGTQNYAWILEELIWPYEEYKEQYLNKNKSASFKEAVEAIEEYKVKNPKPVKTISPASSEEDIAVLFPSRSSSSKSGHIRDYSRTPFLGRSKVISSTPPSKKGIKRPIQGKDTPKQKYKFPRIKLSPLFKTSSGSQNSTSKTTVDELSSTSSKLPRVPTPAHVNSSAKPSLPIRITQPVSPVTPTPMVQMVFDNQKGPGSSPSKLKFGFLGLGTLGRRILKNIMNSGHSVMIWNRTALKCVEFVAAGATEGKSPASVVSECDITFCCVSTPEAAKEVVFGTYGALQAIRKNKGYVDITSVDPDTALDIAEAITSRGGRYLEAPVSGSKKSTEDGELIILAAGDQSLFNDCSTCFQAIAKHAFFLGEAGSGSKMNLVINMILGTMLAGLSEAMALGDRTGVSLKDIVEVLELGALGAPIIVEKGKAIIEGTFFTEMPLQHMQKDLHLALCMGDKMNQPLPLIAASNEVYKHAKCLRYGEHDISAVYLRARF